MISNEVLKNKILNYAFKGLLIPESDISEWKEEAFNKLCDISTGNSIAADVKEKKYTNLDEGYNFIGTKDVNIDGTIEYENGVKIPYDEEGFRYANNLDTLLCIEGGSAGKKIAILNQKVCYGNKLCKFSVKDEKVNPKYIYYFLQSPNFIDTFKNNVTGIIGGVSVGTIKKLKIKYPSREIQDKIVQKVERAFSLLDQKRKNDQEKEKLKAILKEKVLDEAVHGTLVENDLSLPAVDFEEIKNEKPFETPSNWKWVKLSNLAKTNDTKSFSDGPFGSNLKTIHYTEKPEVRIIQLGNIGENGWIDNNVKYTTFSHLNEIARCEVQPGNLVIAKMMPAGRTIIVPNLGTKIVLGSDAMKFVPTDLVNKKYLYYAMHNKIFFDQINRGSHGITRIRTSLGKVKNYILPIPPLEEQNKIVEKIEKIFALVDAIK